MQPVLQKPHLVAELLVHRMGPALVLQPLDGPVWQGREGLGKPKHPDAFVCRVNVMMATPPAECEPALLDTMLGRVEHIGTWFGESDTGSWLATLVGLARHVPLHVVLAPLVQALIDRVLAQGFGGDHDLAPGRILYRDQITARREP